MSKTITAVFGNGIFTTVYVSLIDANVYSPEAYPEGWRAVE